MRWASLASYDLRVGLERTYKQVSMMTRASSLLWGLSLSLVMGVSLSLSSGCTVESAAPPRNKLPDVDPQQDQGGEPDMADASPDLDEGRVLEPAALVLEPAQLLIESPGVGQLTRVSVGLEHMGGGAVSIVEVSLREGDSDTISELELGVAPAAALTSGQRAQLQVSYIPLNTIADDAELIWTIEDAQGRRQQLVTTLTTSVTVGRELNYPDLIDLGRVPAHTTTRRIFPIYNNTDEAVRLRDVYTAPASQTVSVAIADADSPGDSSLDVGFEPDLTLEAHATALLAVTASPLSDQPHQSALFFVSSLGTRQSVMRFNGGVTCFDLEGAARSHDPDWDYIWEVGLVAREQQTRVIASLSSCSATNALSVSALETTLDPAMTLEPLGLTFPLALGPLESQELVLEVDGGSGPQSEIIGGLKITTDDEAQPEVRVRILATVGVECPEVTALGSAPSQPNKSAIISALVGERVSLEGAASPAALSYQWSFARSPVNSTAGFMPDGQSQQLSFVPDLPGVYIIELETFDAQGVKSCQPAKVQVTVM